MDFTIAKQGIFNSKLEVIGYELFFRENQINKYIPTTNGDEATQNLLLAKKISHEITHATNGKLAFINFTEKLLLDGTVKLISMDLGVIEILETVKPSAALLKVCKELHSLGYRLALDDFVYSADWEPYFKYIWSVKLDVVNSSCEQLNSTYNLLRPYPNIMLLAEKVETQLVAEKCMKMGFDLYQGNFFSETTMVSTKQSRLLDRSYAEIFESSARVLRLGLSTSSVLLTIEVIKSGKCSSYKNVKQAIALDEGLKNDSETLIRLMISEANSPKIEKAIFFECIARQLSPSCAGLFFIFGMLSNCLRTKEYDLKDLICNLCEENKKNILIDLLIAEETYELYKINNNYDPSVCSIALNKTQLLDDYNAILDTAHALKIG